MIYLKRFIIILLITFGIGVLPAIIFGNDVSYLNLPAFYPPKILFPIVWSSIFILLSIGLYFATKNDDDPYVIYFIQLIVNALWTVIFFGLKLRLLGFIWIILLFILVVIMTYTFYKRNKLAGLLQIPYLAWLVIAGYLNLAIYLLNR